MMKSKELVAADDSENEFEVDEPEEVASDNEWAPAATTKKRGRPAKNASAKKKKTKVSDDDDEEEILPKKERGSKSKTSTPTPTPTKGRGRAAKGKAKKEEEVEEEIEPEEDDEFDYDEDEDVDEEEDEEDVDEEEEEELNQGPNAKPAKKFTSGAFVVLKTDMIGSKGNPPVWKIDGKALLQKYIPFKQDGKVLYKNTSIYSGWGSNVKEQYYSAPVSFIQQTRKEHIIEFYKDKIKKDPKIEEAAKKELEDDGIDSAVVEEQEKEEQDEA